MDACGMQGFCSESKGPGNNEADVQRKEQTWGFSPLHKTCCSSQTESGESHKLHLDKAAPFQVDCSTLTVCVNTEPKSSHIPWYMVWDIKVHVFRKAVRRVSGMCALHRKSRRLVVGHFLLLCFPPWLRGVKLLSVKKLSASQIGSGV